MNDPVEAAYREYMRALARKGGATTKRRHGCDPRYYRNIGRRGGEASVAARKARIAADLDRVLPGDAPITEPRAAPAADPPTPTRKPMTFREILTKLGRSGPRAPDVSPPRRQSVEDRLAEESHARFMAQMRERSEELEPWDPWS